MREKRISNFTNDVTKFLPFTYGPENRFAIKISPSGNKTQTTENLEEEI